MTRVRRRAESYISIKQDDRFAAGTDAMSHDGCCVIHKVTPARGANEAAGASEPNEKQFKGERNEERHGTHNQQEKKEWNDAARKGV